MLPTIDIKLRRLAFRVRDGHTAPHATPLLNELRSEYFRQNLTMPDLDVIANGKGYFKRKAWRGPHGCIDMNRIVKAVRELGGKISVEWEDQE